ncbi:hypothetical protein SAMN05661080_03529 [Modestobacter sp. DSM 44400]|nr:hypothetical protein [Modestobacter sp. DSM 44400]SDY45270.1 hypothetical protein SAMN05661080_03529 [Modestobacter sp. DSM 44400]
MQNTEDTKQVEHDAVRGHESDEAQAERTPVARMLANPRRVRRA